MYEVVYRVILAKRRRKEMRREGREITLCILLSRIRGKRIIEMYFSIQKKTTFNASTNASMFFFLRIFEREFRMFQNKSSLTFVGDESFGEEKKPSSWYSCCCFGCHVEVACCCLLFIAFITSSELFEEYFLLFCLWKFSLFFPLSHSPFILHLSNDLKRN